jgi:uncharacterized BrkB/YihY/UPF0761 family membrane protein
VPQQDPIPSPRQSTKRRFWRLFRVLVLLALAIAAIAVILVSRGDPTFHVHMMIATGVGIFLTVLVGTGLMTLLFISNSSGHDEAAARSHEENKEE